MAGSSCDRSSSAAPKLTRRYASLRFENPATERAYVESRTAQLVKASSRFFVFLGCFACASFLLKIYRTSPSGDLLTLDISLAGGFLSCCMVVPLLALAGVAERYFKGYALEYLVVGLTLVVLLIACCNDPAYLAKLCGCGEPADPAAPVTDTTVLLKIDCILTLTHVGLPIRWQVLSSLDAVALLTYGVLAFGVGSPEAQSAPQHWVILLCLALGSLIGKHNMEEHERASFLEALHERVQRARLEFELSKRHDARMMPSEREEDAASALSKTTGQLFSDVDAGGGLHRIAALGLREHWLLRREALTVAPGHVLGRGSFGVVVAGFLHGTPVAIKVPGGSAGAFSTRHFAALANELRILRQLRNTYIVSFHGAYIDFEHGGLALVEELVEGPSLEDFATGGGEGGRPSDADRQCLILGICRGLQYLHAREPCIVHGDLKPSNIFVERPGGRPRAKLFDFGLSRLIRGTPQPLGGTLRWMAPEVVLTHGTSALPVPPSPAADIFSLGRVFYFVATGVKPLQNFGTSDVMSAAAARVVPPLEWPADSSQFVRFCAPIAGRCMSLKPGDRPEISAVHDDFFRLRLDGEAPDAPGHETFFDHPSTECVPWQGGLRCFEGTALQGAGSAAVPSCAPPETDSSMEPAVSAGPGEGSRGESPPQTPSMELVPAGGEAPHSGAPEADRHI